MLGYDPETGVFVWRVQRNNNIKAGRTAGTHDTHGYLQIGVNSKLYLAHKLAWLYVHGVWPTEQIDHINRFRDDNRLANLRLATMSENRQNAKRRADNSSGAKGVYWHKKNLKWTARISIDSKKIHLGCFLSFDDAVAARRAAEEEHHPFAANRAELIREYGR